MQRAKRRWLGQGVLMAGGVAAALGLSGSAGAGLVYDLQVAGGGKTALVNAVGQKVTLELHAVVTGEPGNPALESIQVGYGSFASFHTLGGIAHGNLGDAMQMAPFNANGVLGLIQDLNGDGDLDIGGPWTGSSGLTGYYTISAVVADGALPISVDNAARYNLNYRALPDGGIDVLVGKATYTVTSLVSTPQAGARTTINFMPTARLPSWQQFYLDGVFRPVGAPPVTNSAPVNLAIGGEPWSEPPNAPRWSYSTIPAGNAPLVVVTHGRVAPSSTDQSQTWVDSFAADMTGQLSTMGTDGDWQVAPFKWADAASIGEGYVRSLMINRAQEAGRALGKQLAAQHRPFVHLIGEGAGAAVVQEAIRVLRAESPGTVVHATFLDPFVGDDYRGVLEYGVEAAWADSYFTHDHDTLGKHLDARFTEGPLLYAHNVDVLALDPNAAPSTKPSSNLYGPLGHLVSSSTWPRQFYLNTLAGTQTGSQGYGFPLSLEGGGWDLRDNYPAGNAPVVLDGSGGSASPFLTVTQGTALDLESTPKSVSDTGELQTEGTRATFKTGSPVWLTAAVDLSAPANLLTLDAEFLSASGAEGLLSVYWGGTLLGSIDERYAVSGMQSYTFSLPETLAPGHYTFTLRLDPFTDVQSVATIDQVRPGLIALVPEPASLGLLGLGGLMVLRRRRN